MSRRVIETPAAPKPIGPYVQAVDVGGTVYCAGQIGLDPASGTLVTGGIEAQTRQVLANLTAVLAAADLTPGDVVKTTIYLTNLADGPTVNGLYGAHFAPSYPARATVQVAALPGGALIEIDAIAVRPAR